MQIHNNVYIQVIYLRGFSEIFMQNGRQFSTKIFHFPRHRTPVALICLFVYALAQAFFLTVVAWLIDRAVSPSLTFTVYICLIVAIHRLLRLMVKGCRVMHWNSRFRECSPGRLLNLGTKPSRGTFPETGVPT